MSYFEEIEFLNRVEEETSNREKLNNDEIQKIKLKYKNLTDEYLDYLKYIGWGTFRESQFMVYKELLTPSDLDMDMEDVEDYDDIKELVFFGDDLAGTMAGFDLKGNGKIIEMHEGTEIYETGQTFKEYIKKKMLMDENGNDLSE